MNKLSRLYWKFRTKTIGLKKVGKKACIFKPLQVDCPRGISVGSGVFVGHYSWLMGSESKDGIGLVIGNGTTIGHFAHLIAYKNVQIQKDVLIADKVFISDCTHQYEDVAVPVSKQGIKLLSPVVIGEGSWIGENVCICGASIGKHCVIGANSVVTRDIPDYCVAVGSPAKVVKKYDFESNEWKRVNKT